MKKITFFIAVFFYLNLQNVYSQDNFNSWLDGFKKEAIKNGISKNTVNQVLGEAKFLPKVIEYDRYQPEFYEDAHTYVKKRTGKDKF